jgi:hypothetical protein
MTTAAAIGSVSSIEALVRQGAKIDYETLYRKTALIVAAEHSQLPAIRYAHRQHVIPAKRNGKR